LLTAAIFLPIIALNAQDKDEVAQGKKVVETRNFIFTPASAVPLSGSLRQLTVGYELQVPEIHDSRFALFGNGYYRPADATQISIKFTTSEFEYKATPRKKGSWKW